MAGKEGRRSCHGVAMWRPVSLFPFSIMEGPAPGFALANRGENNSMTCCKATIGGKSSLTTYKKISRTAVDYYSVHSLVQPVRSPAQRLCHQPPAPADKDLSLSFFDGLHDLAGRFVDRYHPEKFIRFSHFSGYKTGLDTGNRNILIDTASF